MRSGRETATTLRRLRTGLAASALVGAAAMSPASHAQGFALYVAPPRVDLQVTAGETRRQVLELHHAGQATGGYRFYTNDWTLEGNGSVKFQDALAPGSCRPWVALERRELQLAPDGRYRFRFEVTPPPGTPRGECRFAIMIEGKDTTPVDQGGFKFPVAGRIGVIAYVHVGGAEPKLVVGKASVREAAGARQAVLEVRNDGDATGRLEGFLTAVDSGGAEFEVAPESVPILPGATRLVAINPVVEDGKKPPAIQYPLTVKGTLEWGKNRETLELRFAP
jgi:hypothetical protein